MSSVSPRTALMIAGLMILISQSPLIEYNSYTTSGNEPVLDDTDEQLFAGEQHDVSLVKDIKVETGHAGAPGSGDVDYITKMGNHIYFQAEDTHANGLELWKSDGTASGTIMLKDICPEVNCDGNPGPGETLGSNREMTVIGNTLYFEASSTYCASSPCSTELWKTDGTTSGTVMVKLFDQGYLKYMTPLGNTLFFQADNGTNGRELWKSDGTESGTMMVKDINTEIVDLGSQPYGLTPIGNTLFFQADDGINGQAQLWKSDGTETGTVQVLNLSVSSGSGLKAIGDTLFFWGNNGTYGNELWKYDTASPMSASNPIMVKDITTGSGGTIGHLALMTVIGNTLYFSVGTSSDSVLWKTDGTENGTVVVDNSQPLADTPKGIDSISGIHKAGDKVFFAATKNAQLSNGGMELWTSDGTENGTYLVKDICPGYCSGWPRHFFTLGDIVFFSANDGTNGTELWRSDGTESGTMMVQDINPGGSGSSINGNFALLGDTVYFSASNSTYGADELWKMTNVTGNPIGSASISPYSTSALLNVDEEMTPLTFDWAGGPGNGTSWMVADINGGGGYDDIMDPIVVGTRCYFHADDGTNGDELWAYEATNNSSWMVADIWNGWGSNPADLLALGTRIFFMANDGNGTELWAHEMTNDSTWMVADINNGSHSYASPSAAIGTRLFFSADDGIHGDELWAHEMTNDTTWMVADINNGSDDSYAGSYGIAVGSRYYFNANDGNSSGSHGDLWVYEMTNETMWNLTDSRAPSYGPVNPMEFHLVGSRIYFKGGSEGYANIWAHETTNDTTWKVTDAETDDLWPVTIMGYNQPQKLTNVDSKILFLNVNTTETSLWIHDTTNDTTWNSGSIDIDWYEVNSPFAHIGSRIFFRIDESNRLGAFEISNETSWVVDSGSLRGPSYIRVIGSQLIFQGLFGGSALWMHDPIGVTVSGPNNGPVTNATCEISPTLPTGITLTQGTCTISGTPTEFQNNTNYILWINESGVLDAAFVSIEVQDPEQIYLSPDDITTLLTNNTTMSPMTFNWVVSGTGSSGTTTSYGEGSVWQAVHINSGSNDSDPGFAPGGGPGTNDPFVLVGNNIYFPADGYDACASYCKNTELWAYNPTNGTAWQVADIHPGDYSVGDSSSSSPGSNGYAVVGTTLYFTAREEASYSEDLWAHNDSNGTTWQVKNFTYSGSGVGRGLGITLVGTTLYFDADDGGLGRELWAHDASNGTTWRVADIAIGTGSGVYYGDGCSPTLIGTTLFFAGWNGVGLDYYPTIWAHDTSNGTTWEASPIFSSGRGYGGCYKVIGSDLYFAGRNSTAHPYNEHNLWVYSTANGTSWLASSEVEEPGLKGGFQLIGDTLFFAADNESHNGPTGTNLWAYGVSNNTTWGIAHENYGDDPFLKQIHWGNYNSGGLFQAIDTALYFTAVNSADTTSNEYVWIYETTNETLWKPDGFDKNVGATGATLLVDDILYYDSTGDGIGTNGADDGQEMWAFNSSNGTNWMLADINPTNAAGGLSLQDYAGISMINGVLYFRADDGSNGTELWAYGVGNVTIGASGPDSGPVANATCEISPALSAGITLTQGTCTISGTPTATQSSTVYTLWVNQSGVSDTATIDITVQEMLPDPPSISPESVSVTLMRTVAMGPISFTNIGGDIDTWEVDPALPDGLFLSTSGTISGIPTTVQAAGVYDIWANNSGGSDYAIVTITVEEYIPDPPEISYTSSVVLTQYLQMTPIVPTNTGGVADTWEISPALSPGLILSADGTISGTPTTVESGIVYTIWANNTGGSDSATQIITVEIAPDGLSTSSPSILLVRDGTMLPWYFNYNGENITTWEISPDLPPGLIFDIASKSIYGTPTEMMVATTFTIWANGSEISESINVTIEVLEDTDGDGMPDSLGSHTNTGLIEDLDDDADGISDVDEFASIPATDSLLPDTDGDGICDGLINVTIRDVQICEGGPDAFPTDPSAWEDTDGDGDPDNIEGNSTSEPPLVEDLDDDGDGIPDENESAEGSLTDSLLPDTDGDGVCDGAINVTYGDDLICTGGPDAFPADPTEWVDTDGDEIGNNADLDDDGDQASDEDEIAAGTDPLDPLDFPTDDTDGDGWTDAQEDFCGTDKLDNTSIPADNDADLWCDSDDPDDDNDGWFDTDENDCGTDPLDVTSVPSDTDGDGICDSLDSEPQEEDDGGFPWWLCSLLFLALIIVLPLIMRLVDDAMPENTRVRPEVSGAGTRDDPFILTPLEGISPGESILSKETITITKMTPELKVHIVDLKEKENGRKFLMVDEVLSDERVTMIVATEDGTMDFRMSFSDSFNPTPSGGTFQSTLKVGRNSVYFMWDVAVNSDPDYVKSVVKPSSSETTVLSLQIDSEEDEKPAKKYAESISESDENKGKIVVIKEKIHSMLDRDGDGELTLSDVKAGAVQAGKTVKKGAVKAGKTVKKGAEKTKEKVVAAKDKTHEYIDQKKAKKEAEAAEAEAIADEAESEAKVKKAEAKTRVAEAEARAAEAEADARIAEAEARTAKAEMDAKKAVESVPQTKEEKKAAGLERVKANAAKIDFGTIGVATMSEKDDLQVIKGIGPFIEEKLNALGIYTFQQISKMSGELEDQVNEAIEFFPGRVKRDQWVMQCKTLLSED